MEKSKTKFFLTFSPGQGWEALATILAIFRPYVEEFPPARSAFLGFLKKFISLKG